jgi:MoaA/NifB/PqqE/SkfB family radical SAM enzyme
MEDSVRRGFDAHRNFDNKTIRSWCYAPFVSLYFNTLGDVIACCQNTTFILGNVAHQRLDDIWRGQNIKTLRKRSLLQFGNGGSVCLRCHRFTLTSSFRICKIFFRIYEKLSFWGENHSLPTNAFGSGT